MKHPGTGDISGCCLRASEGPQELPRLPLSADSVTASSNRGLLLPIAGHGGSSQGAPRGVVHWVPPPLVCCSLRQDRFPIVESRPPYRYLGLPEVGTIGSVDR